MLVKILSAPPTPAELRVPTEHKYTLLRYLSSQRAVKVLMLLCLGPNCYTGTMAAQGVDHTAVDFNRLKSLLEAAKADDASLFNAIVNTPFEENKVETAFLFLGIIVLLFVNKETGNIDRVALSNTELAKNTTNVSYVPFSEIKIPLDNKDNIIARAIQSGEPQDTTDWKFLFTPALTSQQARLNQASGGIAYSAVYPLKARGGGAMIFSFFQYPDFIGEEQHNFMRQYARVVEESLNS